MHRFTTCLAVSLLAVSTSAQMRITECQYKGEEFIEFTNVGTTPIDMTGWSFDDDSRLPGNVSLSAFGTVAPGASVILCESSAASFTAEWRLSGIAIIGDNTSNLGRNDEINLYDASFNLVDRYAYGDQNHPGTIRMDDVSGSPCHGALGQNDPYAWSFAFVGDARGSVASVGGRIGNPGSYVAIDARIETFGSGCAGTGGTTPLLDARGCPTAGGYAIFELSQGLASAPALLIYGSARSSIAFGACTLLAFPTIATVPLGLDANGGASVRLDVPRTVPALELPVQAAILDAGASNGLTATAAVELVVR